MPTYAHRAELLRAQHAVLCLEPSSTHAARGFCRRSLPPPPCCAVVTSPAWQLLKEVAAREGLVASAYERRHAQHSRLLQLAKLYLFGASSGGGLARVLNW